MAVLLLFLIQTLTLTLTLVSSMTTDGLSLLALRSAVSLDPTRALSSWSPSDPDPCLWPGVSCRPDGRVSSLLLRDLRLSGYLPSVLPLLSALRSLDLSRNNFSGRVPAGLAALASLSHLDLSENRLSGPLPPSLAALPSLTGVLNLSCNRFSGHIPPEFGNIPVAVSLDLRNNNLSGQIPQLESLLNQGPTAFAGNPGLCGFPLKNPCSPKPTNPKSSPDSEPGLPLAGVESPVGPAEPKERAAPGEKRGASPAVTVSVLGAVILAAFVSVLVLQWQFRKRRAGGEEGKRGSRKEKGRGGGEIIIAAEERREGRSGEIYVAVDEGFGLELEDLLRASAYVVGKSKSGIVYKVVVGRAPAVAVRRLSEAEEGEVEGDEWRRRRAFESEAMSIGRVNHPNVLRLRAYYYAPDEKLLIYDYIPNGTLYSAIHGGPLNPAAQPLPWASRLGIVEGAARGLAHLHECTPRKYIHGNIKTSKILLDDELHPYISGFGLTRLLSGTQKFNHSRSLSRKLGSATSTMQFMLGPSTEYLAPEARAPGSSVTQKSDVYAFGVVLLEVLTGRPPGVKADNDQVELEGFVRRAFKEERPLSEVVDPALLHEVYAKKQVLAVFHIALGCTESDPESRPRMRAVSESLDRVGSQH